MAAAYNVVSAFPTVQVLSGTEVIDVEYITCTSIPSGIGFAWPMPKPAWEAVGASGDFLVLDAIAGGLEVLVAKHHVVAGSPTQDFDLNGLLQDQVQLIIEFPRTNLPSLQGSVDIPTLIVGEVLAGDKTASSACDAEYQRLAHLAAT